MHPYMHAGNNLKVRTVRQHSSNMSDQIVSRSSSSVFELFSRMQCEGRGEPAVYWSFLLHS